MTGHIKLGSQTEEKDFILVDPNQRIRTLVNPMAVKTGTGASDYNDFENWDYWVSENWQAGVSREDPADGGFYYAEADTRWSNRLFLSTATYPASQRAVSDADASISAYKDVDQWVEVGGSECEKVAIPIQGEGAITSVWVNLLSGYNQKGVTISLCADSSGPSTVLGTATANTETDAEGMAYRRAAISYTLVDTTQYWIVIEPETTGDIVTIAATTEADYGGGNCQKYSSSAWTDLEDSGSNQLTVFAILDSNGIGTVTAAANFNGTVYAGNSDGDVFKFVAASARDDEYWVSVGSVTDGVTAMVRWYGDLYVATGSANYVRKITTGDSISNMTWNAELFLVWNGYLWKSTGNVVSYTADSDLSTPTFEDVTVGPDDYDIVGLAGLGENIFCSTAQALWYVGVGDFVYGVTLWDYEKGTNGRGMANRQGALYIPVDNTLYMLRENVPLSNIWNRETTLPSTRAGTVRSVASTSKEVLALVNPSEQNGSPTVWSYNNSGWHQVAKLPPNIGITIGLFDSNTTRLFLFTEAGISFSLPVSISNIDPVRDASVRYEPTGWLDTGWYDGGLAEIIKDFDSVTVIGEGITQSQYVEIYWKDDNSADVLALETEGGDELETEDGNILTYSDNQWKLLGTAYDSEEKIRWSVYDERPQSTRIRLGLKLITLESESTPTIKAVIVRNHPMVMDRWRWQLPIMVSDNQEMVDGSINEMTTGDEIMEYLDGLIERKVPIVFTDIDDHSYEVKVSYATERVTRFEYFDGGKHLQRVVDIALEQAVSGRLS